MSRDFYDILGVEPDATRAEIKEAYHRKALRYHPDHNPGDRRSEEQFKEVTRAYEVLSDPRRRRLYDRSGRGGLNGAGGSGLEGVGDLFQTLNSVISAGFGQWSRAGMSRRGEDIRVEVAVSLEEAMEGVRRDVEVPRIRDCSRCGASGAEPSTRLRRCQNCGGEGRVRVEQGVFSLRRECPDCGGRGRQIEIPCRRCDGEGTIRGSELLPVDVPPGVWDGQTLRWSGKGVRAAGGRRGDLLVDVTVDDHEVFDRRGQDVYMAYPVNFTEASLGAKVDIPTLDGRVRMKVPAGTESGKVFRLRGKGLPAIGDRARGDQYVRLEVTSTEIPSEDREGIRGGFDVSDDDDQKGLWGRVRDFFQ